MGGEWGPGDKGDSSARGGFLSNTTLLFAGCFRLKKIHTRVTVSAIAASPPTTPVNGMKNMRLCGDNAREICLLPTINPV